MYRIISLLLLVGIVACFASKDKYKVYYLPLDAEFYIPPTEEYIEKNGLQFEIASANLNHLFVNVTGKNKGELNENDSKGLRIKIIEMRSARNILITAEKKVLSNGVRYNIDKTIINKALSDITEQVKRYEGKNK